jgi:predicted amidohydrolase
VVAAAPAENDYGALAYRDIDGLVARYEPGIAGAAARRAQLIVLPEKAAIVSSQTRECWLGALARWAGDCGARVVAGLFDESLDRNQLVIVEPSGEIAVTYDKQHPARLFGRGEPKPAEHTPPALDLSGPFPLSGMICVDGDYSDMVRPVARAGGVLAVPTNDWEAIADSHLRSAAWLAVMAGVPLVRSHGHGISAVYDAAGRVVAQADSRDGPVLLVADVHPATPCPARP